jgi:hypothetical protein
VGNHGVKLQGFVNANQRNLATLGPSNAPRYFSNWPSDITEALNEFWSHYNSLQARYEQRFVGGLTLLNSFTWEHSLDNASASLEGNTPSPQNGLNIAADYSQSDYNLPIANVTTVVYDLPFGHGKRFASSTNGLLDEVIGGWQVSAINTAQAGTPFNLVDTSQIGTNQNVSPQIPAGSTYRGANEYRPDYVGGAKITNPKSDRAANTGYVNYINYTAFVIPPKADSSNGNYLSPFGNTPRNPARTTPFNETDLDLNKTFSTPIESLKLQFRAEAYNVFNHTNLYLPSTISGTQGSTSAGLATGATPTLGQITGGVPTSGGQISATLEPRILQFALKIIY